MKFMYFSIKYRYSDILSKKNINFIYNRFFCFNHACYCVGMVSVALALRYVTSASRYQNRSSMYIQGLISWNSTELVEAVWFEHLIFIYGCRMMVLIEFFMICVANL